MMCAIWNEKRSGGLGGPGQFGDGSGWRQSRRLERWVRVFSGHFRAVGMARIATVDGLVLDIELEEIDVTQDFLESLRGGFWDRRPEVKVKGRLRPERERQAFDASCWDKGPIRLTRLDYLNLALGSRVFGRTWALKAYAKFKSE